MQSKTFKGKDKFDLETQIHKWRSVNPHIVLKKRHPIEILPVEATRATFGSPIPEPQDTVSIRVDYEDPN
jgi:hypothetical protein